MFRSDTSGISDATQTDTGTPPDDQWPSPATSPEIPSGGQLTKTSAPFARRVAAATEKATLLTLMPRVTFSTSVGQCAITWRDAGLTGFELPDALARADDVAPTPAIAAIIVRVQKHLDGEFQDFSDLCYDFSDEPAFQIAVLRATLAVKAGRTCSYGDIANACGQTAVASRAVGAALGANRWPLLIPCHRVVAASGKMTGFSGPGGIKTKLRLLALEGAQLFAD